MYGSFLSLSHVCYAFPIRDSASINTGPRSFQLDVFVSEVIRIFSLAECHPVRL